MYREGWEWLTTMEGVARILRGLRLKESDRSEGSEFTITIQAVKVLINPILALLFSKFIVFTPM